MNLNRSSARPRFSLRTLLIGVTAASLLCGGAVWAGLIGIIGALLLLALCHWLWAIATKRRSAALSGVITVSGGILFVLVLPLIQPERSRNRNSCANKLKQIALALQNYHDVYGSFPPAYVVDDNGNPSHSWRTLILPYLEEVTLYRQWKFDEPWNGPSNRRWHIPLPALRCPFESSPPSNQTNYVAVVGPNTAWPGATPTKLNDFTDGPNNTILVVEVQESGIDWMEPRDLHVGQMAPTLDAKAGQGISSHHKPGPYVVFADGHVKQLPGTISPEQLQALLTRNGGEMIDESQW